MALYELIKQLVFPGITIWESHVITILFTTVLATTLAYFILTDREKLIKQLEESNTDLAEQIEERVFEVTRLANIVESSDDAIIGMNLNYRITSWNHGAMEMYGYSPEEITGKHISILMDDDEWENSFKLMEMAKNGRSIEHCESTRLKKDRSKFNASITISPIKNEKGDIVGLSSIARNITRRKKAEKQLKNTIKELKRSNDELQQFAHITSHDLQEPLRTIASFSQLLERRYKGQMDRDADEYIDFIVDAAVHMKEMIQGLLNYSKIGTDKGEMKPVNLNEALKISILNLNALIEENSAVITCHQLPTVVADKRQMVQLFQNLIGNAIKFRKPEKSPEIDISMVEDKEKKEYILKVADNGIGIEKEYTGKIFEIFKRLHTIDMYKGSGIGLAIVKRIIDGHGGYIWVKSKYGNGSTFYFTLPASK